MFRTERIYPFGADRCRKDKVNIRMQKSPVGILQQTLLTFCKLIVRLLGSLLAGIKSQECAKHSVLCLSQCLLQICNNIFYIFDSH